MTKFHTYKNLLNILIPRIRKVFLQTASIIESEIEKILEENHKKALIQLGVIGFFITVLYFAFLFHLWNLQQSYTQTKNYAIDHLRPEYGRFAIEETR